MPYRKIKKEDLWYVENEDTGECLPKEGYESEAQADKYLAALEANVEDADKKSIGQMFFRNALSKPSAIRRGKFFAHPTVKPSRWYASETEESIGYVAIGNTIKSMDAEGTIGGYSVLFTDTEHQDFQGNNFTEKTFLGHNDGDGAVVTFNHCQPLPIKSSDPTVIEVSNYMKNMLMKNPVHTQRDSTGIFSELVCDLSDKYEKMVYDLAAAGKLKWSSGTAPQLYKEKKSGEITRFVIAEQALTPIPAEYKMLEHRVMPMKAYLDFIKNL